MNDADKLIGNIETVIRLNLFLVLLVLLSACSSTLSKSLSTRPAELIVSAPFEMNGRISADRLGKRHFAGLRWIHCAESDELLLLAPLGQTVARIYRDADSATLDSDGKHYQAEDVETLMQQALGWHMPLNGLHHWVLGMADPESPAEMELDDDGRVAVIRQNGWEVRYLRFKDILPSSLLLRRDGLQVKLLVDEWSWSK